MGITEILRRICLFSANEIKSSESFSKHPTQLIIAAYNCHNSNKIGLETKNSKKNFQIGAWHTIKNPKGNDSLNVLCRHIM